MAEHAIPSDIPQRFRWRLERTARHFPERFAAELQITRYVLERDHREVEATARHAAAEQLELQRRHP